MTGLAAQLLAERTGAGPDDGRTLVAANALLGLWQAQFAALSRRLGQVANAGELFDTVSADVRQAAEVIRHGIDAWERPKAS